MIFICLRTVFIFPVRPFASEHEFRNTAAIVKSFAEGIGPHLHRRLLQRAKSRRNWVTRICPNIHETLLMTCGRKLQSRIMLLFITFCWYEMFKEMYIPPRPFLYITL